MKIRKKLMILLLGIALVPLVAASVLDRVATRKLGHHLAGQTREILTEQAQYRLRRLVHDFGRILRRDQLLLESAVRIQAQAIELRLGRPAPPSPRVFLAADIDANTRVPEGLAPSARHAYYDSAGKRRLMPVSYEAQAYVLAPGVNATAVAEDMARLSTMPEIYREIHRKIPRLAHWQYAALASGVHMSYPAHGGYPEGYDPRERPWYRLAVARGGMAWLPPLGDITTRKVMLGVSMPVRHDGKVVGVAAVDVPTDSIFQDLELPAGWAEGSSALFVYPSGEGDAVPGSLAILSSRRYTGPATTLAEVPGLQVLQADDPEALAALRLDALAGRSGVRQMSCNGQPALWAYGAAAVGDPFPIVIVPEALVLAQALKAENYVLATTIQGLQITGVILLAVVGGVVAAAYFSSHSVTRPVNDLADAAKELGGGNYDARVEIRTGDELQALGETFNDIGPKLGEREQMKRSLQLAMEIQQHLLPARPPVLEGFDIAGRSLYCDETGGDYYDFIELVELGRGKLGIAVGDVTGHGIAAALLMASARALLRSHAGRHGVELGALFNELNRHLVRDTGDERFMTLFYGVLDARERALWWTSGGHDPPLWLRRPTGIIEELPNTGIPLGVIDEATYGQAGPLTLSPGEVVLIGTDGIWEARNARKEMFGKPRLRELLSASADRPAEEIHAAVVEAVRRFRGTQPQEDDITLVVIKVL